MNSIWNKNINAFKSRFPSLADIYGQLIQNIQSIQAEEENLTALVKKIIPSWEILPAKNGSPTLLENKIRLHSSYNPEREAQQTSDKLLNEAEKLLQNNAGGYVKASIVFLGFGAGYQICELSKKIKEEGLGKKIRLILIEPAPAYFFATLNILDWTRVFEIEELVLAIGCPIDSVIPLLENQEKVNLGGQGISSSVFFTNPPFIAHNQEYFNSVLTLIERNKSKNEINAATYEKFVKLWVKNSIKNIWQISKCRTVAEIAGGNAENNSRETISTRQNDFLLIAAGPSLEKILPYLHQIKGQMTFVCVETALHALLKADIQPDYIVLTDPQFWAYKHIAGLQAPQSTLICPISVYPDVFRFKCREIVLCSDLFPISRYFESLRGTFGDLGAGGSVASSAWTLCLLLGAKNIYLAGLDLAFPHKQTHIKGSSGEQAFFTNSSKINAAEKSLCRVMYGANPEYGLNYRGEKVLTDSRMKMFAWWFESKIAACLETKTFSLSDESLKIPGVMPLSIEELVEKYKKARGDKESNRKVLSDDAKSSTLQNSDFESQLESYRTNLKKLQALINQAVEKSIINDENLLSELEQINRQLKDNPLYEIIRLGKPSQKYLSEHQTTPPQLAVYQKIQKELEYYLI